MRKNLLREKFTGSTNSGVMLKMGRTATVIEKKFRVLLSLPTRKALQAEIFFLEHPLCYINVKKPITFTFWYICFKIICLYVHCKILADDGSWTNPKLVQKCCLNKVLLWTQEFLSPFHFTYVISQFFWDVIKVENNCTPQLGPLGCGCIDSVWSIWLSESAVKLDRT